MTFLRTTAVACVVAALLAGFVVGVTAMSLAESTTLAVDITVGSVIDAEFDAGRLGKNDPYVRIALDV